MIKLFEQPAEESQPAITIAPEFKTVALAAGALVLVLGVVFWQVVALLLFAVWDNRPDPFLWFSLRADTTYHSTSAWLYRIRKEIQWSEQRPVLATRLAPDGQALLLTLSSRSEEDDPQTNHTRHSWTRTNDVYRYDPASKQLNRVGAELWDQAGSEILGCNSLDYPRSSWARVGIDDRANRVTVDGRDVELAGHLVVGIAAAPSEPLVAVLSADGRRRGLGGIMFSGPGPVTGQHYHQVFSLKDRSLVGAMVRLPSRSSQFGESNPDICWSAGQRYVIYVNGYSGVAIIPVALDGLAK